MLEATGADGRLLARVEIAHEGARTLRLVRGNGARLTGPRELILDEFEKLAARRGVVVVENAR